VEDLLKKKSREGEKSIFILIDPEKTSGSENDLLEKTLRIAGEGVDAFLVGGSLGVGGDDLDKTVLTLKKTNVPVILFPGSVAGISKYADAVLFISLLNSENPYYIIGAQVEGAVIIKRLGLEAIPTAYVIMGEGGAAGYMGRARPIPLNMSYIALAYALAAEMLGMRFIYLESGSGSEKNVPPETVSLIRKNTNLYIITGGGIRDEKTACEILKAGSDAIVLGTIFEKDLDKTISIIRTIKKNKCYL